MSAQQWARDRQFKGDPLLSYGFDPTYYQKEYPGMRAGFEAWRDQRVANMHYGDYVRMNPDLEAHWLDPTKGHFTQANNQSRWAWGDEHWKTSGAGEAGRLMPLTIDHAGNVHGGSRRTIFVERLGEGRDHTGARNRTGPLSATNQAAFNKWMQHHYETTGKASGKFGSKTEWYNSPDQVEIRRLEDQAFQEKLAAQQAEQQRQAQEALEAMYAKARRVKTSHTTGASGAGQFRAKGLTSSENKRGGGSRQFRSGSPQFMATINLPGAGTGKTQGKTPLNVT